MSQAAGWMLLWPFRALPRLSTRASQSSARTACHLRYSVPRLTCKSGYRARRRSTKSSSRSAALPEPCRNSRHSATVFIQNAICSRSAMVYSSRGFLPGAFRPGLGLSVVRCSADASSAVVSAFSPCCTYQRRWMSAGRPESGTEYSGRLNALICIFAEKPPTRALYCIVRRGMFIRSAA